MKNHEAEELHSELVGEVKDHSDTLREWQKDIERNQILRAEIAKLESQLAQSKEANAELVKDKERLEMLANLIWETRWASTENDYQEMVGIAAEIRSGNFNGIDAAIAKGTQ